MTERPHLAPNELKLGLALSGGGARAIAFHLGCLRALNDRGLLDRVSVLSTVSGGSVIGAMWAYSEDDFETFDKRVQALLLSGLKSGILRYVLFSFETPKIVGTLLTSGVLAFIGALTRLFIALLGLVGISSPGLKKLSSVMQAPLPRFASRTTAFAKFLNDEIFKGATLKQVKRVNLSIVINASELRTQSAFRYGSIETGSWRFGKLTKDETVGKAVAASAAFPGILPALDENLSFVGKSEKKSHRVIISDGGVYDNIGTSCLLPGRDATFSSNVKPINFIVACVAGQGLPDGSEVPYFWGARMLATVNTIHRRTHSMTFGLLHRLKEGGKIDGFILPYLGQNDRSLPCPPVDLIPREQVVDYPTDFDAMSPTDINLLSKRGEQLVNNLIETHYPEL